MLFATARELLEDPFLSCTSKRSGLTEDLAHSRRDTSDSNMSLLSEPFTSPKMEETIVEDPVKHMQDFLQEQEETLTNSNSDKYSLGMPYQSKIVQTVSEKVFGSDFNVDSSELADGTIEINVRMPSRTDPQKVSRDISFQFDPVRDTAKKVAQEMATEFDLSTLDEAICAAAIDSEIHKFAVAQSPRQKMRNGGSVTPLKKL